MPRKKKRSTRSEGQIQKACFDLLVQNGYLTMRVNSASFGSHRQYKCVKWKVTGEEEQSTGTSDLIACSPDGVFIAIEMKKPGEKPSKQQKRFVKEVLARGGIALVITSEQELKEALHLNE